MMKRAPSKRAVQKQAQPSKPAASQPREEISPWSRGEGDAQVLHDEFLPGNLNLQDPLISPDSPVLEAEKAEKGKKKLKKKTAKPVHAIEEAGDMPSADNVESTEITQPVIQPVKEETSRDSALSFREEEFERRDPDLQLAQDSEVVSPPKEATPSPSKAPMKHTTPGPGRAVTPGKSSQKTTRKGISLGVECDNPLLHPYSQGSSSTHKSKTRSMDISLMALKDVPQPSKNEINNDWLVQRREKRADHGMNSWSGPNVMLKGNLRTPPPSPPKDVRRELGLNNPSPADSMGNSVRVETTGVPGVGWEQLLSAQKRTGVSVVDGPAQDENTSITNLTDFHVLREQKSIVLGGVSSSAAPDVDKHKSGSVRAVNDNFIRSLRQPKASKHAGRRQREASWDNNTKIENLLQRPADSRYQFHTPQRAPSHASAVGRGAWMEPPDSRWGGRSKSVEPLRPLQGGAADRVLDRLKEWEDHKHQYHATRRMAWEGEEQRLAMYRARLEVQKGASPYITGGSWDLSVQMATAAWHKPNAGVFAYKPSKRTSQLRHWDPAAGLSLEQELSSIRPSSGSGMTSVRQSEVDTPYSDLMWRQEQRDKEQRERERRKEKPRAFAQQRRRTAERREEEERRRWEEENLEDVDESADVSGDADGGIDWGAFAHASMAEEEADDPAQRQAAAEMQGVGGSDRAPQPKSLEQMLDERAGEGRGARGRKGKKPSKTTDGKKQAERANEGAEPDEDVVLNWEEGGKFQHDANRGGQANDENAGGNQQDAKKEVDMNLPLYFGERMSDDFERPLTGNRTIDEESQPGEPATQAYPDQQAVILGIDDNLKGQDAKPAPSKTPEAPKRESAPAVERPQGKDAAAAPQKEPRASRSPKPTARSGSPTPKERAPSPKQRRSESPKSGVKRTASAAAQARPAVSDVKRSPSAAKAPMSSESRAASDTSTPQKKTDPEKTKTETPSRAQSAATPNKNDAKRIDGKALSARANSITPTKESKPPHGKQTGGKKGASSAVSPAGNKAAADPQKREGVRKIAVYKKPSTKVDSKDKDEPQKKRTPGKQQDTEPESDAPERPSEAEPPVEQNLREEKSQGAVEVEEAKIVEEAKAVEEPTKPKKEGKVYAFRWTESRPSTSNDETPPSGSRAEPPAETPSSDPAIAAAAGASTAPAEPLSPRGDDSTRDAPSAARSTTQDADGVRAPEVEQPSSKQTDEEQSGPNPELGRRSSIAMRFGGQCEERSSDEEEEVDEQEGLAVDVRSHGTMSPMGSPIARSVAEEEGAAQKNEEMVDAPAEKRVDAVEVREEVIASDGGQKSEQAAVPIDADIREDVKRASTPPAAAEGAPSNPNTSAPVPEVVAEEAVPRENRPPIDSYADTPAPGLTEAEAATRIQARARGIAGRGRAASVRNIKHDSPIQSTPTLSEHEAATKIQARARGIKARGRAQSMRLPPTTHAAPSSELSEEAAATRIQARARGMAGRGRASTFKQKADPREVTADAEEAMKTSLSEEAAATRIQARARGIASRGRASSMRVIPADAGAQSDLAAHDRRNAAATKIQSRARGMSTRNGLGKQTSRPAFTASHLPDKASDSPDVSLSPEAAATRIQARARGIKARGRAQSMRLPPTTHASPSSELSEEAAATRIQARARGMAGRGRASTFRVKPEAEEGAGRGGLSEEAAATRIQARARGAADRKRAATMKNVVADPQLEEDLSAVMDIGSAVLEELPKEYSEEIVDAIKRCSTPVAAALRNKISTSRPPSRSADDMPAQLRPEDAAATQALVSERHDQASALSEHEAATKIQARARGIKARGRAQSMRLPPTTHAAPSSELSEEAAATRIQARARGMAGRGRASTFRVKPEAEEGAGRGGLSEEAAATRIQARARGAADRRRAGEKKESKQDSAEEPQTDAAAATEEAGAGCQAEHELEAVMSDAEAATKIQARVRGIKVRATNNKEEQHAADAEEPLASPLRLEADLTMMIKMGTAVLEALPADCSQDLLSAIHRCNTPVAKAVRNRIHQSGVPTDGSQPDASSNALEIAEPPTSASASPSHLEADIQSMIAMGQEMLSSLPAEHCEVILGAIQRCKTPVAAALRQRIPSAQTVRGAAPNDAALQEQHDMAQAASKIQARARGMATRKQSSMAMARKATNPKTTAPSASPSSKSNKVRQSEEAAAIKIQARVRGMSARRRTRQVREAEFGQRTKQRAEERERRRREAEGGSGDQKEAAEESAITKIQARARGNAAREQSKGLRKRAASEERSKAQAATKIQARARGMKARKTKDENVAQDVNEIEHAAQSAPEQPMQLAEEESMTSLESLSEPSPAELIKSASDASIRPHEPSTASPRQTSDSAQQPANLPLIEAADAAHEPTKEPAMMSPGSKQMEEDLESMIAMGSEVLSALPAEYSEQILDAVRRCQTPVAAAIRQRVDARSSTNEPQALEAAAVKIQARARGMQARRQTSTIDAADGGSVRPDAAGPSVGHPDPVEGSDVADPAGEELQGHLGDASEEEESEAAHKMEEMVAMGNSLVENLPPEFAQQILSTIARTSSPVASAIRKRLQEKEEADRRRAAAGLQARAREALARNQLQERRVEEEERKREEAAVKIQARARGVVGRKNAQEVKAAATAAATADDAATEEEEEEAKKMMELGNSLLDTLPPEFAAQVLTAIERCSTPVAAALRERVQGAQQPPEQPEPSTAPSGVEAEASLESLNTFESSVPSDHQIQPESSLDSLPPVTDEGLMASVDGLDVSAAPVDTSTESVADLPRPSGPGSTRRPSRAASNVTVTKRKRDVLQQMTADARTDVARLTNIRDRARAEVDDTVNEIKARMQQNLDTLEHSQRDQSREEREASKATQDKLLAGLNAATMMREEAENDVAVAKQAHQAAYDSGSVAIAAAKEAVQSAKRKRLEALESTQEEIDKMKKAAEQELKDIKTEIRDASEYSTKEDSEIKIRIQQMNAAAEAILRANDPGAQISADNLKAEAQAMSLARKNKRLHARRQREDREMEVSEKMVEIHRKGAEMMGAVQRRLDLEVEEAQSEYSDVKKRESHQLREAEANVRDAVYGRSKAVKKSEEIEFHINEELKAFKQVELRTRNVTEKVQQQDRLQIILDAEDEMRSCENRITNAELDLHRGTLVLQALETAKSWRRVQPVDGKPYWWNKSNSKTSYKLPNQLRPIAAHLDAIFGPGSSSAAATRSSTVASTRAETAATAHTFSAAPSHPPPSATADVLRVQTSEAPPPTTVEASDDSALAQQWWSG